MPTSVFYPADQQQMIGIIGGGQLGRMLALTARRIGIRSIIWTGGLESPAVEVADEVIDSPFDDPAALDTFCQLATAATIEFENIPLNTLQKVAEKIPLSPSPDAVRICQNRELEKNFLRKNNVPCTPFWLIDSLEDLTAAMHRLDGPGVLKTASFGYDGKGQLKIKPSGNPSEIWQKFGSQRAVLEKWVPFEKEISVMVVRSKDGSIRTYDPAENQHRNHILDLSIVPARIHPSTLAEARTIASTVAESLNYHGILGVEFFVKPDGSLLVNEMAPRPHNSGHHTVDVCSTSQFDQQLRIALNLPPGSTTLIKPCVMLNLLADFWQNETTPPDWHPALSLPDSTLHLYGKRRATGLRKMGHITIANNTPLRSAQSLKTTWLQTKKNQPPTPQKTGK